VSCARWWRPRRSELGIDVGSIDLVIQVQSPRNVAAALQRVGRAGHLLSKTSKGRIVVTKGEELIEAAAVVRSIRERHLDRIAMPEAPLDVLGPADRGRRRRRVHRRRALYARFVGRVPLPRAARETFREVVRSEPSRCPPR
jgi:ATP-dependent Lhr-like helicase